MIDVDLARRLVDSQFPQWSDLPITRVELDGWDNRTFRLGDAMTVRMPSGTVVRAAGGEGAALAAACSRRSCRSPSRSRSPRASRARAIRTPGRSTAGSTARPPPRPRSPTSPRSPPTLAGFLVALRRVDADRRPGARPPQLLPRRPARRPTRTRRSRRSTKLGDEIPGDAAMRVWEDASRRAGTSDPVWFHGDVATGNLLLRDGRLAAVIDFGTSGVGDPVLRRRPRLDAAVRREPGRVPLSARRRSRQRGRAAAAGRCGRRSSRSRARWSATTATRPPSTAASSSACSTTTRVSADGCRPRSSPRRARR